jgi:hypothetical protein
MMCVGDVETMVLKKRGMEMEKEIELICKEKFKLVEDTEKEEKLKEKWRDIHYLIIKVLKKFCDLDDKYYNLIALWIIGTYFHNKFETYPYLFLNAMRGGGKTRLLRLITLLSKDGQMLNSLTEAVLFRTKGMLAIDEFESITRTGGDNLRELLNSAYKNGTKVKRMRKKKSIDGEEQVVESFEVYRPIAMANIYGMENVLGDRCLTLIIEKSSKSDVTRLIESYGSENNITQILSFTRESDVSDVTLPLGIYTEWNNYILYKHHTSSTNNITNHHLMDKIYNTNIDGRHLELSLPLFAIASYLGEEILDETLETIKLIIQVKKEDDIVDNKDISLIEFISQYTSKEFVSIKSLSHQFREFTGTSDEWINEKWMGRALKRLNLIQEKRHSNSGSYVRLNLDKAQEKVRMFQ